VLAMRVKATAAHFGVDPMFSGMCSHRSSSARTLLRARSCAAVSPITSEIRSWCWQVQSIKARNQVRFGEPPTEAPVRSAKLGACHGGGAQLVVIVGAGSALPRHLVRGASVGRRWQAPPEGMTSRWTRIL